MKLEIIWEKIEKIQYEYYTFEEIVKIIEKLKTEIYRPFKYDIEVISVNKECAYYNDTHDRYVITNFHITTVSHKLVAFTEDKRYLHQQLLNFYYIYSTGVLDSKSSMPITTKERVLEAMIKLLSENENDKIKYALNGKILEFKKENIKNKLLK